MILATGVFLAVLTTCHTATLTGTMTLHHAVIVCGEGDVPQVSGVFTLRPSSKPIATAKLPFVTLMPTLLPQPAFVRAVVPSKHSLATAAKGVQGVKPVATSAEGVLLQAKRQKQMGWKSASRISLQGAMTHLTAESVPTSRESDDDEGDTDCHVEYVTETIVGYAPNFSNPGPEKRPIAAKVTIVSKSERRRETIRHAMTILQDGGWWRNVFDDDNAIVDRLGFVSQGKYKYRVLFRFKSDFLDELPN